MLYGNLTKRQVQERERILKRDIQERERILQRQRQIGLDKEMWSAITGPPGEPIQRLKLALDAGAGVGNREIYGDSALYTLLVRPSPRQDMIELMISHGARAKNISEEISMFHRHIHCSNPTLLQYLFDKKVFESLEADDFAQQLQSFAVQCQPSRRYASCLYCSRSSCWKHPQ